MQNGHSILLVLAIAIISAGIGALMTLNAVKGMAGATMPAEPQYRMPEEFISIIPATSIPPGWKKVASEEFGVSLSVPSDWIEGDLGPMAQGVSWHSATGPEYVSLEYRELASDGLDSSGFLSNAEKRLYEVNGISLNGEKGVFGAFYNPSLWLAEIQIYMVHGKYGVIISTPSENSEYTVGSILSTVKFD